jgi:hypothetical protein
VAGGVDGHVRDRVSFVPLAGATAAGDRLVSRWSKDQVKDAPHAEADGELSQDEEVRLYQHYGLGYSERRSDSGCRRAASRCRIWPPGSGKAGMPALGRRIRR